MDHIRQAAQDMQKLESRVRSLEEEVARKRQEVLQLRGRRTVRFDEATIAEHDKERGTRMKIDEPKTPYVQAQPYAWSATEEDGDARIQSAFRLPVAAGTKAESNSEEEEEDEDEEAEEEEYVPPEIVLPAAGTETTPPARRSAGEARPMKLDLAALNPTASADLNPDAAKTKAFEEARKVHYNEMQKLKEWKAKAKAGLVEEEDDDDDDDDGEEE